MSNEKKSTFEMNIDTRVMYEHMKNRMIGETVTFRELGELIGRRVWGGTANLQSALRRLENEGLAFANVRGVGYQRMNDVEVVNTAETAREHLRRKAKRACKRLACVREFDKLENDMKIKHNAAMSGFGAIASILAPGRMKSLEEKVASVQAQLPLAKTLEAFMV